MNASGSLRHRIEYLALRGVLGIFQLLPERSACRLGELLGQLFFWVDRRHQRVSLENLRIAFGPEEGREKLKSIARRSYQHLGRSLAELALVMVSPPEKVMQAVSVEGLEHFIDAQKAGRGVLYLSAHLGNWELMALIHSMKGYPINVVARPMDNPLLEDLLYRVRTRWGNRVISKGGALREVLRSLKSGETVGFLLDQNVASEQGVFVDFFRRPACTHKTLALLALKSGAAVLPAFIFREDGHRHRFVIEPPVSLDVSGNAQRDVLVNTQKFTAIIEAYVRKYPEQWLWVHRRWKTQPG